MKTNLQNSAKSGRFRFFDLRNPFTFLKSKINEDQYYKEAKEALEPKSYAVSNRLIFDLCRYSASAYHGLSVLFGLATAALVAMVAGGLYAPSSRGEWVFIILAVLFGVLLLLVLIGVEFLKSSSARTVFKKLATKEKIGASNILSLIGAMIISILLSGIGGSFITKSTSDETQSLTSEYNFKTDSISNTFDEDILQANEKADAYFASNSFEGVITWTKDASIANHYKDLSAVSEVLKEDKKQALKDLKGQYATLIATNSKESWLHAYIAFIVITVCELLTLLCYRYRFIYQASTLQEALNKSVFEPWTKNLLGTATVPNAPVQRTVTVPNGTDGNRIGFRYGFTGDGNSHSTIPPAPVSVPFRDSNGNIRNGFLIVCDNCGHEAIKLSSQAKFCSETCKKSYHRRKHAQK